MSPLLSALFALAVIHLLAAMVPGPNMVVTAHVAASRSGREGLAGTAMIAFGLKLAADAEAGTR